MDHAGAVLRKDFDRFDDLISFLTETEVKQCTKFVKLRSVNDYSKTLDDLKFGKHEYMYFVFVYFMKILSNVYRST